MDQLSHGSFGLLILSFTITCGFLCTSISLRDMARSQTWCVVCMYDGNIQVLFVFLSLKGQVAVVMMPKGEE